MWCERLLALADNLLYAMIYKGISSDFGSIRFCRAVVVMFLFRSASLNDGPG